MNARINLSAAQCLWLSIEIALAWLVIWPSLCLAQMSGRPASETYVTSKINAHASTNNAHADIRAQVFSATTNVAALTVAATNATEAAHAATVQANAAILKNTQQDADISYLYASNANVFAIANLANTRAQAASVTNAQNGAAIVSVSNLVVIAQNTANEALVNIPTSSISYTNVIAIYNPTNANEWIDGAGQKWRIGNVTTDLYYQLSGDFHENLSGYAEVPFASSGVFYDTSITHDDHFYSRFSSEQLRPEIGIYGSPYIEYDGMAYWIPPSNWSGNYPVTLSPKDAGASGTAIISVRISCSTTRVDTVAWQSDVTGKVDRVSGTASNLTVNGTLTLGGVSKSAWPAGSSYPTNYIAGFALPIPGTNMIYTLNVSSNGILEVWGVTP